MISGCQAPSDLALLLANLGIIVPLSGTVGATSAGLARGIPAIAFSGANGGFRYVLHYALSSLLLTVFSKGHTLSSKPAIFPMSTPSLR